MIETIETFKKITEHHFVKQVFSDAIDSNQDLYNTDSLLEINPKPNRELTEYEFYLGKCGFTISHLLTKLEQLVDIPGYMLEYHRTKSMAKYNITRLHDISYHYENFIIRSKSIDDQILQLFNSVFHLGLKSSTVNFNSISTNVHVIISDSIDTLKQIHKTCDKFSQNRNQIIHQHSILDADLRKISLMLISSRTENELQKYSKTKYRTLIKEFVNARIPEMEKYILEILVEVIKIFDSLIVKYNEKTEQLQKK